MSGLVVTLKPYEKVLIGGVVLQNGAKRSSLRVMDGSAGVLRLSEALHPSQARTPLTRCYYVAQLIVAGLASEGGGTLLDRLLAEAADAYRGFAFASVLTAAGEAARDGRYCRMMRLLRPVLPQEAALLTDPRFAVPEGGRVELPDMTRMIAAEAAHASQFGTALTTR